MPYGKDMVKNAQWSPILLDIDGTIVASGELVMECFNLALRDLGVSELSTTEVRKVVGPPLAVSFSLLAGIPSEEVDQAVKIYRDYYTPRLLEPPLYPGVAQLIADLHSAGIPLSTATTKMETSAVKQLKYWGLDQYFTVIAGATPDPSCSKITVVADALARLRNADVSVDNPVLVGDRIFDAEGGEMNHIDVIGAAWGYGEPAEFDSPAVVTIAPSVEELRSLLLG